VRVVCLRVEEGNEEMEADEERLHEERLHDAMVVWNWEKMVARV